MVFLRKKKEIFNMIRAETPEEQAAREAGQEKISMFEELQPVAVVAPVIVPVVAGTPLKKQVGRPRKVTERSQK